MTNPVRENIELNVKTVLESVVTPTYQTKIKKVYRYGMPVSAMQENPSAQIVPGDETKREEPNTIMTCELMLMVAVVIEADSPSAATAINTALADVEKALMLDPTRGGYAVDTYVVGDSVFENGPAEPIGDCRIRVKIIYRHRLGDPYTAA